MSAVPGILILIFGLVIAVAIHELGHLIPAKLFGVKVSRYFVGFGPTLWSRSWRGTEWGIKALPLGGFVSIAGMLAPAKPGTPIEKSDGTLTLAEEARRESAAELAPGEENRAFYLLSAPKKLAVMFGGPVTNLIQAFLLLAIVTSAIGMPIATNSVSAVAACVTGEEACDAIDTSPAAGVFEPGDTILVWDGMPVENWTDVQLAIAASDPQPTPVVIERDGEQLTVSVTPVFVERPAIDDTGAPVYDDAGDPVLEERPYVGITAGTERQRSPLSSVPAQTWELAKGTAGIVVALPVHLWNTARDLVTGDQRDADSVVGLVGVADIAGSISAADSDAYGVLDRLADMLLLLAGLNMSLFVFNMIPLLPLDGGHILGALVEGARRTFARWRGRPDPGPVDIARFLPLTYVVVAFFIVMTVLLIVADVVNPVF